MEDFKLITFPELVKWVWSSAGARNDVAVAVCRCLGRISIVDKSHRTVGNLLSDEMLSILCECYNTYSHPVVSAVSALALWHIVHHSEKAKVMVRELMLRSPNSVAVDYGAVRADHARNMSPSKAGWAARALFGAEQDEDTGYEYMQGIQEGDGGSSGDTTDDPAVRAKCFIDSLRVV